MFYLRAILFSAVSKINRFTRALRMYMERVDYSLPESEFSGLCAGNKISVLQEAWRGNVRKPRQRVEGPQIGAFTYFQALL